MSDAPLTNDNTPVEEPQIADDGHIYHDGAPTPVAPQAPAVLEERELRPEHIVALNRLMLLLAHHDEVKAGLEQQIATILSIGYGADISRDNWRFDAERGVIQKLP